MKKTITCWILVFGFTLSTACNDSREGVDQKSAANCGITCLVMLSAYSGMAVDGTEIVNEVTVESGLISMAEVKRYAEKKGIQSTAAMVSGDQIKTVLRPMILHVNGDHFVFVFPFQDKLVCLDPLDRIPGDLEAKPWFQNWKGACLIFEPRVPSVEESPIVCASYLFYTGAIRSTDTWATDVVLVNRGEVPVAITGSERSCACTVAQLPSEPIQPGATASVRIVYRPSVPSGGEFHRVKIMLDHATQKEINLFLIAQVVPAVSVTPPVLWLGHGRPGDQLKGEVIVMGPAENPFRIAVKEVQGLEVRTSVEGPIQDEKSNKHIRYRLTGTYTMPENIQAIGRTIVCGTIVVEISSPYDREIEILVGADLYPSVWFIPSKLPLGVVRPSLEVTKVTRLTSKVPIPSIDKACFDLPEGVEIAEIRSEQTDWLVELRITTPENEGAFTKRVVFHPSGTQAVTAELIINGFVDTNSAK